MVVDVEFHVKQSMGQCGCKSALVSYRSLDGHRSVLQSGVINSRRAGIHTLTLASDVALAGDGGVVLSLGCAAPG